MTVSHFQHGVVKKWMLGPATSVPPHFIFFHKLGFHEEDIVTIHCFCLLSLYRDTASFKEPKLTKKTSETRQSRPNNHVLTPQCWEQPRFEIIPVAETTDTLMVLHISNSVFWVLAPARAGSFCSVESTVRT